MTEQAGRYRAAVRAGMTLIDIGFGHGLSSRKRGVIRSLVRAGASASASQPQVNVRGILSDDDLRIVREAVGAAVLHAVGASAE